MLKNKIKANKQQRSRMFSKNKGSDIVSKPLR
jgi:hypothetical protein